MWRKGFCLILVSFVLVFLGCFEKEDDVGKIREIMGKLDRGIRQNSKVMLDSICNQRLSQKMLEQIYEQKGFAQPKMANRKFAVYEKGAEVSFILKDEKDTSVAPASAKLYLKKKWGRWKIENFEIK